MEGADKDHAHHDTVTDGLVKTWFFLCRPWSVTATLVPALFALGLVGRDPLFSWGRWLLALAAAIPLQIACNLLNTWGDDRSGVDAVDGAVVTTPQLRDGLVTSRQVFLAAAGCLAATCALGLPLLFFRRYADIEINWGMALAAAIGFLGATNYATGVKFKYRGLGVPFVFFLMGSIECFGFYAASVPRLVPPPDLLPSFGKMQLARTCAEFLLLTLPINCLVAVIMHGNDMRDIATDTKAGIVTTASRLGPLGALVLYGALHVIPLVFCATMCAMRHDGKALPWLIPLLVLPLTARTLAKAIGVYRSAPANPHWRGLERASGGIHCLFGMLYALALFLGA